MDRVGPYGDDRTDASAQVLAAIGRSRSVHVTAEDGVAGTRLLLDVAALAAAEGVSVIQLRAAGTDIPLATFDGLVPHVAARGDVSVAEAVVSVITADERPVVLLVDDAAQVDEVSAALLAHLVGFPQVCVVLATRRDDRLPSDLRSIPADAVDLRRTRAGRRARDAAERRLETLEPDERHAVELLAAAGRPVGAAIVAELAGASAVRLLEHDDVIIGDRADRRIDLRLVHRLHRDIVAAMTDEETLRLRRRSLADAIEARGARRHDDALRIALLRDDEASVGGLVRAANAYLLAHRDGSVRAATPEIVAEAFAEAAARLARRALDRGGRTEALELLQRALDRLGRPDEVRALLADADRHVVDADDESRLAGIRARSAAKEGRDQRAAAALREELAGASPEQRGGLLATRLDVLLLGGRVGEAVADGDELLAAGPLTPRVAAPYALALAQGGRGEDALAVVRPILALRDGVDHDAVGLAALARIAALTELGRVEEAAQLGALVVAVADGTDEVGFQAVSRLASAIVEIAAGRVAHAAALADVAGERFDSGVWLGLSGGSLGVAALGHAQAGDLVAARARLRAAEAISSEPRALHHTVQHGRAWWLLVEGHRDRAVAELGDLAARVRADGGSSTETLVLHDLVRIGEPAMAVERLQQLAVSVQGPLARLALDHALALLAGDGRALDGIAARTVEHGMLLVAADTAVQAARAHEHRGANDDAATSQALADDLVTRCDGAFTPQTASDRRHRS